jgi:hypothetical protein
MAILLKVLFQGVTSSARRAGSLETMTSIGFHAQYAETCNHFNLCGDWKFSQLHNTIVGELLLQMNLFVAKAACISVPLVEDHLDERKGRDHAANETREFSTMPLPQFCVPSTSGSALATKFPYSNLIDSETTVDGATHTR